MGVQNLRPCGTGVTSVERNDNVCGDYAGGRTRSILGHRQSYPYSSEFIASTKSGIKSSLSVLVWENL